MNVHIFNGEGLYKKSFLEFMDSHFNLENNIIILRNPQGFNKSDYVQNENIILVEGSVKYFTVLLKKLIIAQKIYLHFLPPSVSLIFWFVFQNLLKKTIWILWGGDLYYHVDRPKNLLSGFYEFLRKRIIKKIPMIACFIKGDYELAKVFYKSKADYCYVIYPLPIKFSDIEKINFNLDKDHKTILIGNSASPANHHIEILNSLLRFKDEKIKIICPLSYANENGYAEKVIAIGSAIFGNRFGAITEIMSPNDYKLILTDVDVAIMNHMRQQGLGNVLSLLYLGKKVYIRRDTTPYSYLTSLGISLFDTKMINQQDFKSFTSFDENSGNQNKNILANEFSVDNYIKIWENLLNIRVGHYD